MIAVIESNVTPPRDPRFDNQIFEQITITSKGSFRQHVMTTFNIRNNRRANGIKNKC